MRRPILKAVEHAGAHKVTGWKQGVSHLLLFIFSLFIVANFSSFPFFMFSRHGLRLPICLLSEGQHVSNTSGPRRYMISRTRLYHYERVSAPGSHSTSNDPGDHEDLSELDQLCLRLYVEYQEALDIQEAIKHDNLLDKENIANALQFLAPNPQPLPRSVAITHHPLSTISNEAPYFESRRACRSSQGYRPEARGKLSIVVHFLLVYCCLFFFFSFFYVQPPWTQM
jgi:hypothetical protein